MSAIREAQRELEGLRKDQAAIGRKIEALEQLVQSGKAIVNGRPARTPLRRHPKKKTATPAIAPAMADQIVQLLKSAGKPLHIKEIVKKLQTVLTAIYRRGQQFKKVKPGTFTVGKAA